MNMWSAPLRMLLACAVLAWPLYPCCCDAMEMSSVAQAGETGESCHGHASGEQTTTTTTTADHHKPSDCPPSEKCPKEQAPVSHLTFGNEINFANMLGSWNSVPVYDLSLFSYSFSMGRIDVANHRASYDDPSFSSGGRTLRALSCLLTV